MKLRIMFRGGNTEILQEGSADRTLIIAGDHECKQPGDIMALEWVAIAEEEMVAAVKRGDQLNIELIAAGPTGIVAQTVARLVHWATATDLTPDNHLELHYRPGPPRTWRYTLLEVLKDGTTRELYGD